MGALVGLDPSLDEGVDEKSITTVRTKPRFWRLKLG